MSKKNGNGIDPDETGVLDFSDLKEDENISNENELLDLSQEDKDGVSDMTDEEFEKHLEESRTKSNHDWEEIDRLLASVSSTNDNPKKIPASTNVEEKPFEDFIKAIDNAPPADVSENEFTDKNSDPQPSANVVVPTKSENKEMPPSPVETNGDGSVPPVNPPTPTPDDTPHSKRSGSVLLKALLVVIIYTMTYLLAEDRIMKAVMEFVLLLGVGITVVYLILAGLIVKVLPKINTTCKEFQSDMVIIFSKLKPVGRIAIVSLITALKQIKKWTRIIFSLAHKCLNKIGRWIWKKIIIEVWKCRGAIVTGVVLGVSISGLLVYYDVVLRWLFDGLTPTRIFVFVVSLIGLIVSVALYKFDKKWKWILLAIGLTVLIDATIILAFPLIDLRGTFFEKDLWKWVSGGAGVILLVGLLIWSSKNDKAGGFVKWVGGTGVLILIALIVTNGITKIGTSFASRPPAPTAVPMQQSRTINAPIDGWSEEVDIRGKFFGIKPTGQIVARYTLVDDKGRVMGTKDVEDRPGQTIPVGLDKFATVKFRSLEKRDVPVEIGMR